MSSTFLVGCVGLPAQRRSLFTRCSMVELAESFDRLPRAQTARGWREEADAVAPGFAFVLDVPSELTHRPGKTLALDGEGKTAWQRLGALGLALRTEAVVVHTPAGFTPSVANRDRLRAFARATADELPGVARIWEPLGLWSVRQVDELCGELDWVPTADPLAPVLAGQARQLPTSTRAYLKVRGLGQRRSFGSESLAELVEAAAGYERCWVVFDTRNGLADAARFVELVLEAGGEDDEDDEDREGGEGGGGDAG